MIGAGTFAIIAGLYAWQVHGILFGILTMGIMFGATFLINLYYMTNMLNREETDNSKWVKHLQYIKWTIFIIIMVTIAITGSSVVQI